MHINAHMVMQKNITGRSNCKHIKKLLEDTNNYEPDGKIKRHQKQIIDFTKISDLEEL